MKNRHPSNRTGFTMIEILIVIGLMIALMSILVFALGNVMGTARETATKATLKKTSVLLAQRVDAFERWIQRQNKRAGRNLSLQSILLKKQEFRFQFPQQFSEDDLSATARNWPQNDPNFVFNEDVNNNGQLDPGEDKNENNQLDKHTPDTENSECLYYFLTQGESFGAEPVGTDAFSTDELADTDNDGLMEIIDAWGNPIRFYRWPTRLIRPATQANLRPDVSPANLDNFDSSDPDDPSLHKINVTPAAIYMISSVPHDINTDKQKLRDLQIDNDDPIGITELVNSQRNFERCLHTRNTYHLPILVSAGPDGALGLYEPNDATFNPVPTVRIFQQGGSTTIPIAVYKGVYDDTGPNSNFGRLAQPIRSQTGLEARYDNLTNLNLQPGGGG